MRKSEAFDCRRQCRALTCALLAELLIGCSPRTAPSVPAEIVDPQQEALFKNCIATRDHQIHQQIFAAIDNPDVQRELLATQKEQAIRECRKQFPKKLARTRNQGE